MEDGGGRREEGSVLPSPAEVEVDDPLPVLLLVPLLLFGLGIELGLRLGHAPDRLPRQIIFDEALFLLHAPEIGFNELETRKQRIACGLGQGWMDGWVDSWMEGWMYG